MSGRVKRVPKIQTLAGASFAEALNEMQGWSELQLREVAESPASPSIQRMAAQTLVRATNADAINEKTGAFAHHQDIDRILDRTVGKPSQSVKVEGSLRFDAVVMTIEEAQRVMASSGAEAPAVLPVSGMPEIEFPENDEELLAEVVNNHYDTLHANRDPFSSRPGDTDGVPGDAVEEGQCAEPDAPGGGDDSDALGPAQPGDV